MLVALAIHDVEAVLIQLYAPYVYDMKSAQKGDKSKLGPDFFSNSKKGFIVVGASVNMTVVGVLIVKLNFLLFFRRLTRKMRWTTIIWWAVLLFTVAGAVAQIVMQEFRCFFGSFDYIFGRNCTSKAALARIFFNSIFSSAVDALSDIFSKSFPAAWKTFARQFQFKCIAAK